MPSKTLNDFSLRWLQRRLKIAESLLNSGSQTVRIFRKAVASKKRKSGR